ncbi:methylmalonyl-CoA mutase family protein [Bacillus massilinigeriensis]|uniref:methylmalonyl-CoA mutase family protein n=1 Tax=Bacillus mediterraneensis TaxID=1805474 RepID=UPI001F1A11DA|nr:methylmalonyl-CoA mutase family protein [Bacillus mediterraneensis]
MQNTEFPEVSLEDWEQAAEASLKGKPLDCLYSHTYENIRLKPLYTAGDAQPYEEFPGFPSYRRGINAAGYAAKGWHNANPVSWSDLEELKTKLAEAFSRGQTTVSFHVNPKLFSDTKKLSDILNIHGDGGTFCLRPKGLLKPMLAAVIASGIGERTNGIIAADVIAEAAIFGSFPADEDAFFKDWGEMIGKASGLLPNVRTVLVDVSPYHNAGANAVQELAIAVSTSVYYIRRLLEQGWELEKAMSKIAFHFSTGANFFMETAKFRAARLLWSKAAEAFGADSQWGKSVISAETSIFTKTIYDPYVNLLRAGNEAFAAVLGGVQFLEIGSFDNTIGASTLFSERIAGNTHSILKEEALLEKVADPAGGSWYIESLTRTLAEEAWKLFLYMEDAGGMLEALKSGMLQEQIAETRDTRNKDIDLRKQSIIGTNIYSNPNEEPAQAEAAISSEKFYTEKTLDECLSLIREEKEMKFSLKELGNCNLFTPLVQERLAAPFESLKNKSLKIRKQTEKRPAAGLLCLGEPSKHKARADFVAGFLAAGGIASERHPVLEDVSIAIEWMKSTGLRHFCICGKDEQYKEYGIALLKNIKAVLPESKVFLAGLPAIEERETWIAAGVDGFIHMQSGSLSLLNTLLTEMEVTKGE